MGEAGLKILREAADRHGLLTVSEVMDQVQIPLLLQYSDVLQVGGAQYAEFQLAA